MSVFWLKITYTFLTDRNAFFHPFYRSNYKYFTDYEFLPVIGFNAGDEDNNFVNIKRYAIFRAEALPQKRSHEFKVLLGSLRNYNDDHKNSTPGKVACI